MSERLLFGPDLTAECRTAILAAAEGLKFTITLNSGDGTFVVDLPDALSAYRFGLFTVDEIHRRRSLTSSASRRQRPVPPC